MPGNGLGLDSASHDQYNIFKTPQPKQSLKANSLSMSPLEEDGARVPSNDYADHQKKMGAFSD